VSGLLVLACQPPQQEAETPESVEDDSVTTPGGGSGFVVKCTEPEGCLQQVSRRCPGGYEWQPVGQGATTTSGKSHSAAVGLDTAFGAVAVGAAKGESRSQTEQAFLIECADKSAPTGGIGSPCETADNCASLRVGLRKAGLADAVQCAPALNGKSVCTFLCASEDADKAGRLEQLCSGLKRKCIATGEDAAATTCQVE
jgi:hypothetical protein